MQPLPASNSNKTKMDRIKHNTLNDFIFIYCNNKEISKVRHFPLTARDTDFGSDPLNLMNLPMLSKEQVENYVHTLFSIDPNYPKLLNTELMRKKYKTKSDQNYADSALETYEALVIKPGHKITIKQLNLLISHQDVYRKDTKLQVENSRRISKLLSLHTYRLEIENNNKTIEIEEKTKNHVEAIKRKQGDINQKTEENYKKTELLIARDKEIAALKQQIKARDNRIKQLCDAAEIASDQIVSLQNEIAPLKEQNSKKNIEIQNLQEKIDQKDKAIDKSTCNSITVKKTKKRRTNRNNPQYHLTLRYTDGACTYDILHDVLKETKKSLGRPITFQFQMIKFDPEMSIAKCCFPEDFDKKAFFQRNSIISRPWIKDYDDKVGDGQILKKRVIVNDVSLTSQIKKDLIQNLTVKGHAPILTKAYKKRNHSIVILIFGSNDKDKIEEIYNLDLDQILSEEYICKCSWWKPKKPKKNLQNENSNSTSFCSLDSIN